MGLTDQAITKIKDSIVSGELAAGDRLPKETELAERLGLSRNSLREAVRALTLVGFSSHGKATARTSRLSSRSFSWPGPRSSPTLLTGPTLRELYDVRRILEPTATALATPRLVDDHIGELPSRRASSGAGSATARSAYSGWSCMYAATNGQIATILKPCRRASSRAALTRVEPRPRCCLAGSISV